MAKIGPADGIDQVVAENHAHQNQIYIKLLILEWKRLNEKWNEFQFRFRVDLNFINVGRENLDLHRIVFQSMLCANINFYLIDICIIMQQERNWKFIANDWIVLKTFSFICEKILHESILSEIRPISKEVFIFDKNNIKHILRLLMHLITLFISKRFTYLDNIMEYGVMG